ncbi:hypothetical protein AMTRI_Chr02g218200 [Amborella trichopoda]
MLIDGMNDVVRKARQIMVGSFCPPLDDTFGLEVRGSLMTLLEWSPMMHSSFLQKDFIWVRLWGVPLHVWNVSVFKKIINSFGEYCDEDHELLSGPNASFIRVKINRFLGIQCPR